MIDIVIATHPKVSGVTKRDTSVEDMNLLMVVDSKLMSVTIGKKCKKIQPYVYLNGSNLPG